MTVIQALLLLLAAGGATAVVLTREPVRQAAVMGIYGIVLALLFFALMAPDVALSEIVVNSAAFPLLILLTAAKARRGAE